MCLHSLLNDLQFKSRQLKSQILTYELQQVTTLTLNFKRSQLGKLCPQTFRKMHKFLKVVTCFR